MNRAYHTAIWGLAGSSTRIPPSRGTQTGDPCLDSNQMSLLWAASDWRPCIEERDDSYTLSGLCSGNCLPPLCFRQMVIYLFEAPGGVIKMCPWTHLISSDLWSSQLSEGVMNTHPSSVMHSIKHRYRNTDTNLISHTLNIEFNILSWIGRHSLK